MTKRIKLKIEMDLRNPVYLGVGPQMTASTATMTTDWSTATWLTLWDCNELKLTCLRPESGRSGWELSLCSAGLRSAKCFVKPFQSPKPAQNLSTSSTSLLLPRPAPLPRAHFRPLFFLAGSGIAAGHALFLAPLFLLANLFLLQFQLHKSHLYQPQQYFCPFLCLSPKAPWPEISPIIFGRLPSEENGRKNESNKWYSRLSS